MTASRVSFTSTTNLIFLQGFAELETSEVYREAIDELPKITGRRMYLVNKEGAAQSSLRTAQPSIKYDALGDFYLAGVTSARSLLLGANTP